MSTIEHIVGPEELMAYLDGELLPERAATVRAHLSDCRTCQSLAADLAGLADDLRAWQLGEAPTTLRTPSMDAVRPTPTRWANWRSGLRHAAAAALVIVALGVGIWSIQSGRVTDGTDLPDTEAHDRRREASARFPPTDTLGAQAERSGGGAELRGLVRPGRSAVANRAMAAALSPSDHRSAAAQAGPVSAPGQKIIRSVTLTIETKEFDRVRPAVDGVLRDVAGFVGNIQVSGDANAGTLYATLRVPADRLGEAVAALRSVGRVTEERQVGDDVTDQVRDLEARLTNSRNTEKRLTEVLRSRTGRVSDVLEVEREIARVREEIERMDAERTNVERRVAYATITLQVVQERQATLKMGPVPLSTKIRNATVDGLRRAFESAITLVVWTLRLAPALLLWLAVLWWPARIAVRHARRARMNIAE